MKAMAQKKTSSDAALETSVAILRDGIGPDVAEAFVIAPLWAPGIGCVGVIALASVPYTRCTEGRRRGLRGGKADHPPKTQPQPEGSSRGSLSSRCRHVVGAGVIEFVRRVGMAVGGAVFRSRTLALVEDIRVEGDGVGVNRGCGGSKGKLPPGSGSPPPGHGEEEREVSAARDRR